MSVELVKPRPSGGYYEDRDSYGTSVHWSWLKAHWHALADKLEALEERGVLRRNEK